MRPARRSSRPRSETASGQVSDVGHLSHQVEHFCRNKPSGEHARLVRLHVQPADARLRRVIRRLHLLQKIMPVCVR
jgi:hypothetical protein